MEDLSKVRRAFVIGSESWYYRDDYKYVMVGLYPEDGGTHGEFEIRWENLQGREVPRLMVFDDAWIALTYFKDVIDALAEHDGENLTDVQIAKILKECGLVDITEREIPSRYKHRNFLEKYDLYLEEGKTADVAERILFEWLSNLENIDGLYEMWCHFTDEKQNEILSNWYDIIVKTR